MLPSVKRQSNSEVHEVKFKITPGMKVRFLGTTRHILPKYVPGAEFEIEKINLHEEFVFLDDGGGWDLNLFFREFEPVTNATPDRTIPVYVALGYDSLFNVLTRALEQAQSGKGKERHAAGEPFTEQPIFKIGEMFGLGFQNGQALKKMVEAQGMLKRGEFNAAEREVLGAINYLAAVAIEINKRATAQIKEREE